MKKNIDTVFQEKFKNAEVNPPEEIWDGISAQLPFKKQKKRITPIWYLMAGTAAALAIVVLIFIDYSSPASNPKISDTPELPIYESQLVDEEVSNFQEIDLNSLDQTEYKVVQSRIQNTKLQKDDNKQVENKIHQFAKSNTKIAYSSNNATENGEIGTTSRKKEIYRLDFKRSKLIQNDIDITANDSIILTADYIAVAENIITPLVKNELVELKKTQISKRLSVTTAVGALHFDNLSNGRSEDEHFTNTNINSEITTSYAINFGYQISQKIKIRTGISSINLGSNTQIETFSSISETPEEINRPIPYNPFFDDEIEVLNQPTNNDVEPLPSYILMPDTPVPNTPIAVIGVLNQNIGFIEIPSEVEYLIVDKKIGINIIGGISTLFLNRNNSSLNTENSSTDLGKINNLNEISFTANAGLGLLYKISPQFQFNVEPIFKYQLNTFKDTKNLNPYYFGMYSGIRFKF